MPLLRTLFSAFLPIVVLMLGFGLAMAILVRWKRKKAREQRRDPFTTDFLRIPGESCDEKIQELNAEFDSYVALIAAGPVIVFAIAVSQAHFGGVDHSIWHFMFFVLVGIAVTAYFALKLVKLDDKRRRIVLGRQGELATAQELDQLMLKGCRVFHDVPMDKYGNINHVVISGSGVYAVETKARRKPKNDKAGHVVTVDYDAGVLRFPGYPDRKVFEQTETQRRWLSQFLEEAVGEKVPVESIIALPGWKIERLGKRDRSSATGTLVINPRNPHKFFVHPKRELHDDKMIQRIAHQVETRCRKTEAAD
jgi:hypothetical protein